MDDFAAAVVACPNCKTPLALDGSRTRCATCGADYRRAADGAWDLRISYPPEAMPKWRKDWEHAQDGFVAYEAAVPRALDWFLDEISSVRNLYEEEFRLSGAIVDIGGYQGRLRHFLADRSRYVSVDPFTGVFAQLETNPAVLEAYPTLAEPCNFVQGFAEALPIKSGVFDYAHMRSVIDHLHDPYLALLEAWRVLKPRGQILVGTRVVSDAPAPPRRLPLKSHVKLLVTTGNWKPVLEEDHHFWHPNERALTTLIEAAGFKIKKAVWQSPPHDDCLYVLASKHEPPD